MPTAWKDERAQRYAISTIYSAAQQAPGTISSVLQEIIDMATEGVKQLNNIRAEANLCKKAAAAPHDTASDHGADSTGAATGVRLDAIQSIERAYQRIQEGLNVARLDDAGTLLGCQQELEHPGGGDDGRLRGRGKAKAKAKRHAKRKQRAASKT